MKILDNSGELSLKVKKNNENDDVGELLLDLSKIL